MTDALHQIAAAAAITGHPVDTLLAHLGDVAKPMRDLAVHANADVDCIAVSLALPDDQWLARRMANLANAISQSTALAQVALARAGHRRAERGIGRQGRPARGLAGVFSALTITGPSTLAAELAAADAAQIPAPIRDQLATRARLLGLDDDRLAGHARTFRTLVYSGPEDATTSVELGAPAPPGLVERATASAPALDLSAEDARRLHAIHTALAGRAVELRLTASQSRVEPGFTLGYAGLSADDLMAFAGQFSDAGVQRMQSFVDALASASSDYAIDDVSVAFGARPLGPLWVGFRLG